MEALRAALPHLSDAKRRAAIFALEHPERLGPSSVREIAAEAGVSPNAFIRLSQSLGFQSFKEFKAALTFGTFQPMQQARDLQARSALGQIHELQGDVLRASQMNLEALQAIDAQSLQDASSLINQASKVYVLGVGIANALAQNFAYLGAMALDNIVALPRDGSEPVDGLVRAAKGDCLIAMTFKPYRREVVEAVEAAQEQGVDIIAISDSPAAPHFIGAQYRFVVPGDTPQFFTSTVALSAFLEMLMAFVIAAAPAKAIKDIAAFHERRHKLGIYVEPAA